MKNVFFLLPIIAFGMEVMTLRQTSYQVIHELKNKMISSLSWMGYLKEDISKSNPEIFENDDVKEDFVGWQNPQYMKARNLQKIIFNSQKSTPLIFHPAI